MASYQPTILPAQESQGLLPGFMRGFDQFSGMYTQAALGDFFDKKRAARDEEKTSKYRKALEAEGYELDNATLDGSGNQRYSYRKHEPVENTITDPVKAIKMAMAGMGPTEGLEGYAGAPKPMMSMPDGNVGDIYGQSLVNQEDTVRNGLLQKYAPGMDQGQIAMDLLGLKEPKPAEIPVAEPVAAEPAPAMSFAKPAANFTEDISRLKQVAESPEAFVIELDRLALKYIDNPDAIKRLSELKRYFGARMSRGSSGRSAEDGPEDFSASDYGGVQ